MPTLKQYIVDITRKEYGSVLVETTSEQEAKAYALIEEDNGNAKWNNSEVTTQEARLIKILN